jgi:nucleotide-binding universal stress UspA family protein
MIVVGVDGSECSRAALRFALEEARIRQAKLRIIVAWHVPLVAYGAGWAPPPPGLAEDSNTAANDILEEALQIAKKENASVEIESVVREGQSAQILVEEAKTAELLVIGSRGRGGFRDLLLGSVSQQCAHHAHCPVTIIHSDYGCAPPAKPTPE